MDLREVEAWPSTSRRVLRPIFVVDPYQAGPVTAGLPAVPEYGFTEYNFNQASIGRLAKRLYQLFETTRWCCPTTPDCWTNSPTCGSERPAPAVSHGPRRRPPRRPGHLARSRCQLAADRRTPPSVPLRSSRRRRPPHLSPTSPRSPAWPDPTWSSRASSTPVLMSPCSRSKVRPSWRVELPTRSLHRCDGPSKRRLNGGGVVPDDLGRCHALQPSERVSRSRA